MKISRTSRLYKFAMWSRNSKDSPIETGCQFLGHLLVTATAGLTLYVLGPLWIAAFSGLSVVEATGITLQGKLLADFAIIMPLGLAVIAAIAAVATSCWWIGKMICKMIEIEIESTDQPATGV